MGLIANYQYLSDENLKAMKNFDGEEALESFDIVGALHNLDMETCKKAELYPDIWEHDLDFEGIKKEVHKCFEDLIDFYKQILEINGNVLVTIY